MKMFLMSSVMFSTLFCMSSHPVIMMVLIISQTMILCLSIWLYMKTSWFSYILFLIFLGGLMVLFIYITSLASNELMVMKMINTPQSVILMGLFLCLMILNSDQQGLKDSGTGFFIIKSFNFLYSWNNCVLLATTMLYLFLTLVIVVKISNKFEAPLKNLIHK